MSLILQNFASALTTVAIGTTDTSITVGSTSSFPTLSSTTSDYFYAVITSAVDLNQREIVKVTAISGSTLTVTRAQEYTTALAFPVGSLLELRATSQTLKDAIKQQRGGYSKIKYFTANTTLTADDIGGYFCANGDLTITLPLFSTLFDGDSFVFKNSSGSGKFTVKVNTDIAFINIAPGKNSATVDVYPGCDLIITKYGPSLVAYGSAILQQMSIFSASLLTNGYQKLPSGLIIQWGGYSPIAANSYVNITFPISFPNSVCSLNAVLNANNTVYYSGQIAAYNLSPSQMRISNSTASSQSVWWQAIGY